MSVTISGDIEQTMSAFHFILGQTTMTFLRLSTEQKRKKAFGFAKRRNTLASPIISATQDKPIENSKEQIIDGKRRYAMIFMNICSKI